MQVDVRDGAAERSFLIECIATTEFLSRITGKLPKEPLRSDWANLILGWCLDYFAKYGTAPGRQIEVLFSEWAKGARNADTQKLVERFLGSLSAEYERQTQANEIGFVLDTSEKYLNEVRLDRVQELIRVKLERGDVEAASVAMEASRRIQLTTPPFVDVLRDKEAQRKALENKQRVLIRYPGAAGQFFGEEFSEDSFVAIMASAKGGKSYTLLDIAWRAMMQGRKVAYFQVGDLSADQIMRRFHRRACYRPLQAKTVRMPTGIVLPIGDRALAMVDREEKVYEKDLTWQQAEKSFASKVKKFKGEMRLSHHPIKTVSVNDVRGILDNWDRDGWKAKVVIIDYAYNLAYIDPRGNPVDQISMTWAMMRQISEMRKCCVVTADQSNKEGFRAWVLTRTNFSGSKMILAHVTAFLGVNCTDEEKSQQIVRYNFLCRREEEFSETRCLYCASCLDVANPIVVSTLPE